MRRRAWGPLLCGGLAALSSLAACTHDKRQIVNESLTQDGHQDLWKQEIQVGAFSDASWSRFGFYDKEGPFEHQYGGQNAGYFEYDVQGPDLPPAQITIQARLSAESNDKGQPHETSDVTLTLNGVDLGTQTVVPDDQKGRVYSWKVRDPELLKKIGLKSGDRNVLRFTVKPEAQHKNGLCLYGEAIDSPEEGQPILVQMTPR